MRKTAGPRRSGGKAGAPERKRPGAVRGPRKPAKTPRAEAVAEAPRPDAKRGPRDAKRGRVDAKRGSTDAKPGEAKRGPRDVKPAGDPRPALRNAPRPAPPPPPKREQERAPLPDGPSRTGTVAIIGRPNVGKSTLLNAALEMPLAIVSPTPQTTRDALLGVVQHGTAEIGLLDTPGMFAGQTALDRVMITAAEDAAENADVVVFVTAVSRLGAQGEDALRPHHADLDILRKLPADVKVIVVLNKIDLVRDKRRLLSLLAELAAVRPVEAVVPVSALREDGVRRVLDEVAKVLPEGERRFGDDDITDRPARFFAREYVREQILLATREEVPHAVAISIDGWEEGSDKRASRVSATIHVERLGQKKILVGAGGDMLTRIGSQARARLAELVGGPVHLELFVRVTEDWRSKPGVLRDLGYGGDAVGEGGATGTTMAEVE